MPTGMRTTYTDSAPQKRTVSDLVQMIDPNDVPLIGLLGLDGSKKIRLVNWPGTKPEWLEDSLSPREDTLGAAVSDTSTTSVTVSNGEYFQPGHVIEVDSEQMWVSAVSGNVLTVTRGFGGTTAATHSNGATVEIVTVARVEGATSDPGHSTSLENPYNYTQIFHKQVEVSRSQQKVSKYGIDNELDYQLSKIIGGGDGRGGKGRAGELPILLERAAIRGNRYNSTNTALRTMGGLQYYITTNVKDLNGAALTQKVLEDYIQKCWENGGNPNYIITSGHLKRKISSFYAGAVRTGRDEKRGGLNITEVDTDFGTLSILLDRWVLPGELFIVDESRIGFLEFDAFFEEELGKLKDGTVHQVVGEYSFFVCNEKGHARIKGASIAK